MKGGASRVQQSLWEDCAAQEPVAGLDEAGRGCLAGPVVAGAVILPPRFSLPGLDDSKRLTPGQRERLAPLIRQQACAWGLGLVWPRLIDRINILQASLLAMARALACLGPAPALLLVDGRQTIPSAVLAGLWRPRRGEAPLPRQQAIVHGDQLYPAISAASVLAKTARDALMERLDRRYPGYGLARHKGYGTREHLAALCRLGPSRLHRLSFRGVRQDQNRVSRQQEPSRP